MYTIVSQTYTTAKAIPAAIKIVYPTHANTTAVMRYRLATAGILSSPYRIKTYTLVNVMYN